MDVATYKAEFLAHYYENNARPLHAYAFGMVDRWAKLGSKFPRLANFFSSAPGFRQLAQSILQLSPKRKMPQLATTTFQNWARKRKLPACGGVISNSHTGSVLPEVILWADTFNNYFHPETSRAALEVLQGAGFRVIVPQAHLCCGRPLYDFGLLDNAKEYLERIMTVLGPQIKAGIPIVVLEPSCASVFRDELRNLFPHDERAKKLRSQTFLLSEFLEHRAPGYSRRGFLERCCCTGTATTSRSWAWATRNLLLRKTGAELQSIDSGCCGMAGPFGFEKDKYEVSQAVGERVLLPAVRNTPDNALIVSDGFSCREQIHQSTGRRALHLAEVLQLAMKKK